MIIESINIEPLLKAFKKFELFRLNLDTEQEQAGAIQAFEYCFELSWKMMKRLLEVRGKIANSPRETYRMAALERFISDPETWFDFLTKRNMTMHTYEEKEALEVISIFPKFSQEVKLFLINTQAHLEEDFEESDLPYKVDIVDWNKCSKSFQELITKDLICIQKK